MRPCRGKGEEGGLTVTYVNPEGEDSVEEGNWVIPEDEDEEAYWEVEWLGDGRYMY